MQPKDKIRVYVAGRLADPAVDYLGNCHRMMLLAEKVRRRGFSVYVPCLDLLMGIMFGHYTYEDYFDNSQAYLATSDAMVVQPVGAGSSSGVGKEKELCESLGIPMFCEVEALEQWAKKVWPHRLPS